MRAFRGSGWGWGMAWFGRGSGWLLRLVLVASVESEWHDDGGLARAAHVDLEARSRRGRFARNVGGADVRAERGRRRAGAHEPHGRAAGGVDVVTLPRDALALRAQTHQLPAFVVLDRKSTRLNS